MSELTTRRGEFVSPKRPLADARGSVSDRIVAPLEALGAPRHILAAFDFLQFDKLSADRLRSLNDAEREAFLKWSDERQLTLMLPSIAGSSLPRWLWEQVAKKEQRYTARFARLKRELFEIVQAFDAAGLQFVMLKGLSHAPAFMSDARLRAQGDIDLWLTGPSVYRAQRILRRLGYVPLLNSNSRHLPPMARPSSWRWRGDLFDPEMPISVELHYELWSEAAEYVAVPGLEEFWNRKEMRDFDGHKIPVLSDADLLGFASLHLLLHLLHGDLPLQRAWEIGRFLENCADKNAFWKLWRTSHSGVLGQIEITMFCLVSRWFACRFPRELGEDAGALPADVQLWLDRHSLGPLTREWAPNKAEIWLHLALITKRTHRARVLFRRLLPTSLPVVAGRSGAGTSLRVRWLLTRVVRHVVTLLPTILEGLRWFRLRKARGVCRTHKGRCAYADPRDNLLCSVPSRERAELQDGSRRRSNARHIPE